MSRRWILAGLVGTLVLALVPVLLLGRSMNTREVPGFAVAAEAAPRVQQLLSYTPESVESDLAVEQVHLTEDYRAEYAERVRTELAPQSRREGISVAAEITDVAVVDATVRTMVVLMLADVLTWRRRPAGGATQRGGTKSGSRIRVRLEKVQDHWLISRLDLI